MRAGVPAGVPFGCLLPKNIGLFLSYLLLRLEVIQGGGKQKPPERRARSLSRRPAGSERQGRALGRPPRAPAVLRQGAGCWPPGVGAQFCPCRGGAAHRGAGLDVREELGQLQNTGAAGRRCAYLEIPSSCTELTLQGIPLSKVTGHLLTRPC